MTVDNTNVASEAHQERDEVSFPSWMERKPLDIIGQEIIDINTANGWNVLTPADWENPTRLLTYLMLQVTELGEAANEVLDAETRKQREARDASELDYDAGARLAALMENKVVPACVEAEHVRKPSSMPSMSASKPGVLDRAAVAEELADVLIRVLDMSHGLGIDMDAEVVRKMAKNRTRGYKHGGKLV